MSDLLQLVLHRAVLILYRCVLTGLLEQRKRQQHVCLCLTREYFIQALASKHVCPCLACKVPACVCLVPALQLTLSVLTAVRASLKV